MLCLPACTAQRCVHSLQPGLPSRPCLHRAAASLCRHQRQAVGCASQAGRQHFRQRCCGRQQLRQHFCGRSGPRGQPADHPPADGSRSEEGGHAAGVAGEGGRMVVTRWEDGCDQVVMFRLVAATSGGEGRWDGRQGGAQRRPAFESAHHVPLVHMRGSQPVASLTSR